ncbi:hypothetical protein [Streptomyces colonosanans]|uniref:Uncharacterized protein n=1 Tax=Streptomyces colonosanans TaxID=1428652 RepID=A0A1S2PNN9_9ACTN|nr:hypothetical protein [Streptomyces colonosanans]OIJ95429.1 hypothetical protein BIV24_09110 [Streptomyces colonosanans]
MTVLQLAPAPRDDHPHDGDKTGPEPIVALHQRVADFDLSQRDQERGEEAAFQAVLHADAVLTGSFPDTLDTVVQAMSWTGHPPVPGAQLMASAVTYLGSADGQRGWWLHYTRREEGFGEGGDLVHVLTLIAPCSCGTYINVELADEDHLIVLLDELDTEPGAPVDCDYQLRIRASSYADPAHASIETPF